MNARSDNGLAFFVSVQACNAAAFVYNRFCGSVSPDLPPKTRNERKNPPESNLPAAAAACA